MREIDLCEPRYNANLAAQENSSTGLSIRILFCLCDKLPEISIGAFFACSTWKGIFDELALAHSPILRRDISKLVAMMCASNSSAREAAAAVLCSHAASLKILLARTEAANESLSRAEEMTRENSVNILRVLVQLQRAKLQVQLAKTQHGVLLHYSSQRLMHLY